MLVWVGGLTAGGVCLVLRSFVFLYMCAACVSHAGLVQMATVLSVMADCSRIESGSRNAGEGSPRTRSHVGRAGFPDELTPRSRLFNGSEICYLGALHNFPLLNILKLFVNESVSL